MEIKKDIINHCFKTQLEFRNAEEQAIINKFFKDLIVMYIVSGVSFDYVSEVINALIKEEKE